MFFPQNLIFVPSLRQNVIFAIREASFSGTLLGMEIIDVPPREPYAAVYNQETQVMYVANLDYLGWIEIGWI
jgi:hypothetical protein